MIPHNYCYCEAFEILRSSPLPKKRRVLKICDPLHQFITTTHSAQGGASTRKPEIAEKYLFRRNGPRAAGIMQQLYIKRILHISRILNKLFLQSWARYNWSRSTLKVPRFLQKMSGIWRHPRKILGIWIIEWPLKNTSDLRDRSLFMAGGGDRVQMTFYKKIFRGPLITR